MATTIKTEVHLLKKIAHENSQIINTENKKNKIRLDQIFIECIKHSE